MSSLHTWILLMLLGLTGPAAADPVLRSAPTAQAARLPMDGSRDGRTCVVRIATITVTTSNPAGADVRISADLLSNARIEASIPLRIVLLDRGAPPPVPGALAAIPSSSLTFFFRAGERVEKDVYAIYAPGKHQAAGEYSAMVHVIAEDR